MELLQLVDVRVEEASRPLREEVAALKLMLARVGDSLEPTEACTYGCFSPRASLSTSSLPAASIEASKVAALDLQIMPVLQGLHGESSVMLPMELVSLEALVVATTPSPLPSEPCQPPDHVDSGGLDASVTLSSVAIGHMVSLSDEIVDAGVLAPNSEALFAKELSDLFVSLEAASPGYGMEIASVLAGKASDDIIRKVEKSLRRKKKKRVISWKFTRLLD
jgi:hypothetical protein